MRKLEELTEEELNTTAEVLQILDANGEDYFNESCAEEFRKRMKISESDVADLASEFNEVTAPNILLMNSCGYRMLLSTFVNVLIAMDRKDLGEKIMTFRMKE
jgi:hypothetical protein